MKTAADFSTKDLERFLAKAQADRVLEARDAEANGEPEIVEEMDRYIAELEAELGRRGVRS